MFTHWNGGMPRPAGLLFIAMPGSTFKATRRRKKRKNKWRKEEEDGLSHSISADCKYCTATKMATGRTADDDDGQANAF